MHEEYFFENSYLRLLYGNVSFEVVNDFLVNTDIGSVQIEYEEMSPMEFILIKGNPDIALSKKEKNFIGYIHSCFSVKNENQLRLFVIELNINDEEPFVESAALIKIFNLLFEGDANLYLFISNGSVSLGSRRDISEKLRDNFCISNFYDDCSVEEAYDFFNSSCETIEDFVDNIVFNSKIEHTYSHYDDNCYPSQYDENLIHLIEDIVENNDDLNDSDDSENINGAHLESQFQDNIQYSYILKELNDIGEYREAKSAFELLQESQQLIRNDDIHSYNQLYDVEEYDEDADAILNEILNSK
jgi:hypothetical protein